MDRIMLSIAILISTIVLVMFALFLQTIELKNFRKNINKEYADKIILLRKEFEDQIKLIEHDIYKIAGVEKKENDYGTSFMMKNISLDSFKLFDRIRNIHNKIDALAKHLGLEITKESDEKPKNHNPYFVVKVPMASKEKK